MSMTESEREEILSDIRDGYIEEWDNLTIDELFKQIESEHKEIQQYRAIGTVSEFRELKEKATAKHKCPNCNELLSDEYRFCPTCRRKVDWSEGKE